jgi:hypothetical protein
MRYLLTNGCPAYHNKVGISQQKNNVPKFSTRDFEFDTIYVNGSNNLPNLRLDHETWKVRLIEEEFMKRMWDVEGQ